MKKILIIGAGFAGSVIARTLAEVGYKITIVEKRNHIGGNCYDYIDPSTAIRIHKYGPHLFHTNNKSVYNFLSHFTEWSYYRHKVKALLSNGDHVTLPANQETLARLGGREEVINTLFRPYTKKMWNKELEELDPTILQRVPIRDDDNECYFPNDEYQCMPKHGYTELFKKMLDHENIEVNLNFEFKAADLRDFYHVFNSMPIDQYYNFCYGELPYRSIKFHHAVVNMPRVLPTTTVNFTHSGPCTRVTEWKQIPNHGENPYQTILTTEEPCDYKDNNLERFYPVKDIDGKNKDIYLKYKKIENEKMTFIGRCGTYQYLDIHQVVSQSLATANNFIKDNI